MTDNFPGRLAEVKWATKADIADFIKETAFDKKLKNINKKVTSNKTKHVLVQKWIRWAVRKSWTRSR